MKSIALLILVAFVLSCAVDYAIAGYGHGHGHGGGYASHWQYDNGLHAPYKGHGGHGGYGGHGLHGAPGLGYGYGYGR